MLAADLKCVAELISELSLVKANQTEELRLVD